MGKTLYLEKRGCAFFDNDSIKKVSDIGNYRVGSYDYSIKGKDGIQYILEFTHYDRYTYRTKNLRTGKTIKTPKRELELKNALHISTQYEDSKGLCWANLKLVKEIHKKNLLFTLDGILEAVNEISCDTYDKIEFID